MLDLLWRSLAVRRQRVLLYVALGAVSFVLAMLSQATRPAFSFMLGDASGYYAYLPSVVIDHDLDLRKQLALGGQPQEEDQDTTPRGLVNDRYPIGVSVTLAPAFVVAHALAGALHLATGSSMFAPDGFSIIYQVCAVAFVVGLAVATMILIDGLAASQLHIAPSAVGLAAALYWVGSSYFYYVMRQPLMAHVIGGFWVACAVGAFGLITSRWARDQSARQALVVLALCSGMAVITRPTNATLLVFVLYVAWLGARVRRLSEVPLLAAGVLPLMAQLWVWKLRTGSFVYYSYGMGFDWLHPALWQTLVSSQHGLFFWTPLLVLAMLGFATRRTTRSPVLWLGIVALILLWIANSAWEMWWFASSFGGRAFLDLSVFFVLGLALYLERRKQQGERPFAHSFATALVCAGYSLTLMAAFMLKVIPDEGPLLPWF